MHYPGMLWGNIVEYIPLNGDPFSAILIQRENPVLRPKAGRESRKPYDATAVGGLSDTPTVRTHPLYMRSRVPLHPTRLATRGCGPDFTHVCGAPRARSKGVTGGRWMCREVVRKAADLS